MRRAVTGEIAFLLTVFALSAEPALAQTTPTSGAPRQEAATKADTLFEEGRAAIKQQKWMEAEAKFLAAFALNPSYDVATNLGQTQYRLGKYRDAAEHLAFALRSWPITAKLDQRDAAAKRLAELRKLVATVTIRVSVPDAAVFVDGKQIGRSPLAAEVFIEPGAKTIEAKLAGFQDAKQSIEAAVGSAQEVSLTLVPVAETGAPNGNTPAGGQTGFRNGGLGAKRDTEISNGGPSKSVIIAGIAASAVALTGGMVFAITSSVKASEGNEREADLRAAGGSDACGVPSLMGSCMALDETRTTQRTLGNLSIWSFVAGGLFGAGTAIYVLATPKPKPKSMVHVAPIALSRGGGVTIVGRF